MIPSTFGPSQQPQQPSTIELLQQHVWPLIWPMLGEEARREIEPKPMIEQAMFLILRYGISLDFDPHWLEESTLTAKVRSVHTGRILQTSLSVRDIHDKFAPAILNLVAAIHNEKLHFEAFFERKEQITTHTSPEMQEQSMWLWIWDLLGEETRRELEPKSMGDKILYLIVCFGIDLQYRDWVITAKALNLNSMRTVQVSIPYSDCDNHASIENKTVMAVLQLVAKLHHVS